MIATNICIPEPGIRMGYITMQTFLACRMHRTALYSFVWINTGLKTLYVRRIKKKVVRASHDFSWKKNTLLCFIQFIQSHFKITGTRIYMKKIDLPLVGFQSLFLLKTVFVRFQFVPRLVAQNELTIECVRIVFEVAIDVDLEERSAQHTPKMSSYAAQAIFRYRSLS